MQKEGSFQGSLYKSQRLKQPMIALAASVLLQKRHEVIKASGLVDPVIIDVSPNKENISLNFIKMKNESYKGSNLQWVADMVSHHSTETPHYYIL